MWFGEIDGKSYLMTILFVQIVAILLETSFTLHEILNKLILWTKSCNKNASDHLVDWNCL